MDNAIFKIYKKLHTYFGPQKWWPARNSFEVIVGAILTQNTNWQNVERAIANLRKENFLTPDKLKNISSRKLAKLIKPAGYFNIKTKRLKSFLKYFFSQYNGHLDKMRRQSLRVLREELLCVNGIGPETADSILLYALDKPSFVVDAYTKRVFSRHSFIKETDDYQFVQRFFMERLPADKNIYNEYHALIVKLAKEFCSKRKSKCGECVLKNN
jgi:endonuclease III related protein